MNSEAMLPPAPGLFSTPTCWPHISESRAPTMRPIPSMPPPGVNGTTSLTMRVGHACGGDACASAVRPPLPAASADVADIWMRWRRVIMLVLSCGISLSITDADAGFLDDRAPFRHVGPDRIRKRTWRRGNHHHAHGLELLPGRGIGQRRDGVGVEPAHDLHRSLGRNEQPDPRGHVKAGHAGF